MHYVKKLQQQVEHLEAKLEGRARAFRSIVQSRFDKSGRGALGDGCGHRIGYRQAIEEVDRMMTSYKNIEADYGEFKSVCTGCGWPISDGDEVTIEQTHAGGRRWAGDFCDVGCVEEFGFVFINGEYVMSR